MKPKSPTSDKSYLTVAATAGRRRYWSHLPVSDTRTACGVPWDGLAFTRYDPGLIDCRRCRRTKAFRALVTEQLLMAPNAVPTTPDDVP